MRLSDSDQPPVLVEENVPRPQPGRGELLVQIYAAGVTPTELLWYPTTHNKGGEKRSRCAHGAHETMRAGGGLRQPPIYRLGRWPAMRRREETASWKL